MNPLLFVHIPKTAGSSFRTGIDRLLGEDASMRDYGLESSETSDEVRRSVYADADSWKLRAVLSTGKIRMLVGHFPVMRYAGLFNANKIFTIMRDPVQRVVSEYGHFVRNYGFKGSLIEFSRQAPFVNRQANMLAGVPLEAIGLVGLTERYPDTMSLFEESFGFRPPTLAENMGRMNLLEPYELSAKEDDELHRLNQRDMALYRNAARILEQRLKASGGSAEFVRGNFSSIDDGVIRGWAVCDSNDAPVVVELWHDDDVIGAVSAIEPRPILKGLGLHRGGFVGFSFKVPHAKRNGVLRCRVQGSGLDLNQAVS